MQGHTNVKVILCSSSVTFNFIQSFVKRVLSRDSLIFGLTNVAELIFASRIPWNLGLKRRNPLSFSSTFLTTFLIKPPLI